MYIAWRGLLFVTNGWAVLSLSVVTTIVPTLLFLLTTMLGTAGTMMIEMINSEILSSAIKAYEKGGLYDEEFLKKAHLIYNSCATFPPNVLNNSESPYLLGVVFSYLAKYYSDNINHYTSIVENALFCFDRAMKPDVSISEYQCAAMRMLLLIDDNDCVMKGIAHKFYEQKCQELYGQPLMFQRMLAQGMDAWTFEMDILKHIGFCCIMRGCSVNKYSIISALDYERFTRLTGSGKYDVEWPLVKVSEERVYELFSEFISEYVNTPYERRITLLSH